MRVFEDYNFNLKDRVRFKETKPLIDQFLAENGICYDGLGFIFSAGNFKGLLKKYSELQKYIETDKYMQPCISSVSKAWESNQSICIDKTDEPLLNEILTKIPRPYNAGFISVCLYNVHWFDDINAAPCFNVYLTQNRKTYDRPYHDLCGCYCNCIILSKEFDYGNKFNPFIFRVERTKNFDELTDPPAVIDKAKDLFGKPSVSLRCMFDESEEAAKESADLIFRQEYDTRTILSEFLSEYQNNCFDVFEQLQPLKGLSPKKEMIKYTTHYGYQYKSFHAGCYHLEKTNQNNHTFQIEFVLRPLTSVLEASIIVKGYNFSHGCGSAQVLIKTQDDLTRFVEKIFFYAEHIESIVSKRLFELYGRTPNWYAN